MLFSQIKKRRCAICWGPVVQRWNGTNLEIICPRNCEPGGHVSEEYVDRKLVEDMINASIVADAYPELIKEIPMTKEEIEIMNKILWGE